MIADYLESNSGRIRDKIETTDSQWKSFLKRLKNQELQGYKDFYDEQVWTFLVMSWYADNNTERIRKLVHTITLNKNLNVGENDKIWLEALPIPPRMKEGNTNIDMALGAIELRELGKQDPHSEKKGNGIKYSGDGEFICFCEMKWYSDIDKSVTHDRHRNQMIRLIENALNFRNDDNRLPNQVFVTLITPNIFKKREPKSRFYAYKFEEYKKDKKAVTDEMKNCCLKLRYENEDELESRAGRLILNWVTYEDIIQQIGNDELGIMIKNFYKKYCGCYSV
jgi:hypothetical protein